MMHQKRLMMLGGTRFMIPAIKAAHEQGYYVITCDYLPNNIAHEYSDEYVNVSIIDKDAVLAVAKEKKIDGIISFAVDPGVVPAAYVQEKLGLPAIGPYKSVEILQNKDLFRSFMKENGFNVPWSVYFDNKQDAVASSNNYKYPVIVKPVDGSGSKGVTRVDAAESIEGAIDYAFEYSRSKKIIIEQFIEKAVCTSDSDAFSYNGELKVVTFSAQRFDEKAAGVYVPAAYSWPSAMSDKVEKGLASEIQRLLSLLLMGTTLYNIETRVGIDGKPYIMEVTPRAGGNRLAEMTRMATGVDMITAAIRASVGDPIDELQDKPLNGHWAEVILHSPKEGIFKSLEIDRDYSSFVVEKDLWVNEGDRVETFSSASNAIGTLVLRFDSAETMEKAISKQSWWKVIVK